MNQPPKPRQSWLNVVLVFLLGVFVARLPATVSYWRGSPDWSGAVSEVRDLLMTRYVEQPSEESLQRGAIEGMIDTLNDRYTQYVPPTKLSDFHKDITGEFVGIGATVNTEDGWLVIVSPLENSPALRAGLWPGDRVTAIGGKTTHNLAVDECVKLLQGKPSTPAVVSIERNDAGWTGPRTFDVTIDRAEIAAATVRGFRYLPAEQRWDYVLDPKARIGYMRIEQFTPTAAQELVDAIEQTNRLTGTAPGGGPLAGLILDLRDNGGGLLEQAIAIADLFLDSGTIVSTRGRAAPPQTWTAQPGQILGNVPLVVMCNELSASASEVVAGALADQSPPRAVIVGTRSFGKGLVQVIERLNSVPDARLKMTEQHYYLPSGRMLQRTDNSGTWGVDPTPGFYVPLSEAQRLPLSRLRRQAEAVWPIGAPSQESSGPLRGARWSDRAWLREVYGDGQLAAALDAVQERLAGGTWKPTGGAEPAAEQAAMGTVELARLDRLRERMLREMEVLERRIDSLQRADGAARKPRHDSFWPDATDIVGGSIEVKDKSGAIVSRLRITGPDVERWLLDAEVTPEGEAALPAAAAPAPATAPPTPGGKP